MPLAYSVPCLPPQYHVILLHAIVFVTLYPVLAHITLLHVSVYITHIPVFYYVTLPSTLGPLWRIYVMREA